MATEHSVSRLRDFIIGIAKSMVTIGLGMTALRVIPSCVRVFQDFDAQLPDMTKAVIILSRFLGFYWYLLSSAGAGLAFRELGHRLHSVATSRSRDAEAGLVLCDVGGHDPNCRVHHGRPLGAHDFPPASPVLTVAVGW